MKNRLLSSVAVTAIALGFSAPALAQPPALNNWAGFYVGLNAGGAWGRSSANTSTDCSTTFPAEYFCNAAGFGAANGAAVNASGSGTVNASGFTGGVQAGYNWQANNVIYGLETDFGAFNLKGSRQGIGNYPVTILAVNTANADTVSSSISTNWLYTFRGRLGVALPSNLMAYATGGLALTRLTVSNSFSDNNSAPPGAVESASDAKLKTGWVLGGGLEWALSNDWTVRGEYLYVDFGKVTAAGTITNVAIAPGYAQGMSTSSDLTAQVARIGVNRKF